MISNSRESSVACPGAICHRTDKLRAFSVSCWMLEPCLFCGFENLCLPLQITCQNTPTLTILHPHFDFLALPTSMFWTVRLTILHPNIDYLALRSSQNGHPRQWERFFWNVKFNFFRCQDFLSSGAVFASRKDSFYEFFVLSLCNLKALLAFNVSGVAGRLVPPCPAFCSPATAESDGFLPMKEIFFVTL